MKSNKNRVLYIIVTAIFLISVFSFKIMGNATEQDDLVGREWIKVKVQPSYTTHHVNTGISIAEVHDKNIMLVNDSYVSFNAGRPNMTSHKYYAEIPLNSQGGTYNIGDRGVSEDFSSVVGTGARRWYHESVTGGRYLQANQLSPDGSPSYGSPFQRYVWGSIGDYSGVNNNILYYPYREDAHPTRLRRGTVRGVLYHGVPYFSHAGRTKGNEVVGLYSFTTGSAIYKYETEIYRTSLDIYTMSSRADSENIFFSTRRPGGKYNKSKIKNDGTGYSWCGVSEDAIYILTEIPKHNYLLYATGKGLYRSNTDWGEEVQLLPSENIWFFNNYTIHQITDNYIYYSMDNGNELYRQHIKHTGINEKILDFVPKQIYTPDDETFYYIHNDYIHTIYKYSLNDPPELTLNTPLNSTENSNYYIKEEGNIVTVGGSVRDANNDTVTVTATIDGETKTKNIANTASWKTYSFTFDIMADNISEGTHKVTVSATDPKGEKAPSRSRTIIVKAKARHNDYVLVNSSLVYSLLYEDEESDPKYQEQFRYMHNPNYFKNPMGVLSDNNIWRSTLYNKLALPGHYKLTYRAKDNPKNNSNFDEFRKWSRESLSEINLYVHRKPIAIFKATANSSGKITVTNYNDSYDPDHQGEANNGIIAREWKWKSKDSPTWTYGSSPPTSLPVGQNYVIGLRVRDKDGINGVGVWSDWTEVEVGAGTLAPLNALFTLNPSSVSHSKTITARNLSTGPISKYEWVIRNSSGAKVGATITSSAPSSAQLKVGGIGKYTLQLRVGDATRWSEPYTLPYQVINNPPIASFNSPDVVYRDTNISLVNTTPPDLDGDNINYLWKLKQPNGTEYHISTSENPSFRIQNFISFRGINPIDSISKDWEIRLIATDAKGAKSEYTRALEVINHLPVANISGNTSVKQYTTHTYTSNDTDADTGDNPLNILRWKHTKPDGSYKTWNTKNIEVYFDDHGKHTIEHYVFDQIGAKSNTASLTVDVIENKPPSIVIESPAGTKDNPAIISNDPLMEWAYSDEEEDPQEKYSFDFYYADDDTLITTVMGVGSRKWHQLSLDEFDDFRTIKVVGRVYSKFKWSELSNEVYFIINNPPTADFRFNKSPPVYVRGENIGVTSYSDDPDMRYGDYIEYEYYLVDISNNYTATFLSNEEDFAFTIDTLPGSTTSKEWSVELMVTDSLGWYDYTSNRLTIKNQPPNVNITVPSSSRASNPSTFTESYPTIKWEYNDLDGDEQDRYRLKIYEGTFNNILHDTGEISSSNKYHELNYFLEDNKLYSVDVQVRDGREWSEPSERKYFKIGSMNVSNIRITGVYDIAWLELFQNPLTRQPTNYTIPVPSTNINPISKHPNNPNIPIKVGYKVDFEVDAMGLSNIGDRVEAEVQFLDIYNNNVTSSLKYISNNRNNTSIGNEFKTIKARKISDNMNRSTWRFSYYLPATTFLNGKNELIIKTNIKGIKSSSGQIYNYNVAEGWNGKLFQYTLKENALEDYYIRGRN